MGKCIVKVVPNQTNIIPPASYFPIKNPVPHDYVPYDPLPSVRWSKDMLPMEHLDADETHTPWRKKNVQLHEAPCPDALTELDWFAYWSIRGNLEIPVWARHLPLTIKRNNLNPRYGYVP